MLAWPAVPTTTSAEDDLEKPRPLLERAWPGIRDGRASLPSFLGDTTLTLRARTHYGDLQTVTPIERQAWASGGWLAYRSGWLLDGFQLGATYYGSAPVYAPADKDGSLLLAPGPQAYHVLGEAFAALRYQEYALLKGYRQFVRRPFINGLDNRMTPNTFEGLTLAGQVGPAEYFAGYLTMPMRSVIRVGAHRGWPPAAPPPGPLPQGEGEHACRLQAPSPCGRGLGEG